MVVRGPAGLEALHLSKRFYYPAKAGQNIGKILKGTESLPLVVTLNFPLLLLVYQICIDIVTCKHSEDRLGYLRGPSIASRLVSESNRVVPSKGQSDL